MKLDHFVNKQLRQIKNYTVGIAFSYIPDLNSILGDSSESGLSDLAKIDRQMHRRICLTRKKSTSSIQPQSEWVSFLQLNGKQQIK